MNDDLDILLGNLLVDACAALDEQRDVVVVRLAEERDEDAVPDDVAGAGEVAEEEQEADGPREVEEPVRGHADAEREHETAE